MGFLKNLTVIAIASLLSGLRAQDTGSDPLSHSLEIRNPEALPTCTYAASVVPAYGNVGLEFRYAVMLTLPGEGWNAICSHESAMEGFWQSIRSRCERQWTSKGLKRIIDQPASAGVQEGLCRMKFTVQTMPEQDKGYPTLEDGCIWDEKPDTSICGLSEPDLFPWPSECSPLVCLWPEYFPNTLHQLCQWTTADNGVLDYGGRYVHGRRRRALNGAEKGGSVMERDCQAFS